MLDLFHLTTDTSWEFTQTSALCGSADRLRFSFVGLSRAYSEIYLVEWKRQLNALEHYCKNNTIPFLHFNVL